MESKPCPLDLLVSQPQLTDVWRHHLVEFNCWSATLRHNALPSSTISRYDLRPAPRDQAIAERKRLCATCVHARIVESTHGSRYTLCRLSQTDARFRKYPPLPVLTCSVTSL